ncbi:hypothetical protein GGR57DRAFT_472494 [Xylariaceae sp. FL1272]|nr:hypothetical protein GGR57DRAFT_472494 [Xylariaceae sp. FL1272]
MYFISRARYVLLAVLTFSALIAGNKILKPWAFEPLPLGSIHPEGWLLNALQSYADGLPGHLFSEADETDGRRFYSYVRESPWLQLEGRKSSEYGGLNEALPYWFNGLVPLAYSLQNRELMTQVRQVAQTVLGLQEDDGWLGPEDFLKQERVLWGRYPFLLGLTQLAEANLIWSDQIVTSLRKFVKLAHDTLDSGKGYNKCKKSADCMWAQTRVADFMITIQWLLENHPSDQDGLLWDTLDRLHRLNGYKWEEWYVDGVYQSVVTEPSTSKWYFGFTHGVNVGQGLKSPAVIWRFTHNESLLATANKAVDATVRYHSSPSGSVLGDEILRDRKPYLGSELCTAVETGYSFSYLYHTTGLNSYADAAERVYFNAIPAQTSHNGWGHQYMDQPNQPFAQYAAGWDLFTTSNSGAATVYGLEPTYPCCTVNYPQGLPKLNTHSWARVGKVGLAHMLLVPSHLETTIGEQRVTISCKTSYPFSGQLTYSIDTEVDFELHLRVPGWNPGASVITNGTTPHVSHTQAPDDKTGMHRFNIASGHTTVTYTIDMKPRAEPRDNGAVSIYVGSLLFSLDIGTTETSTLPHAFNHAGSRGMDWIPFDEARDYSYSSTSPWNVAIDPNTLVFHGMGPDEELPEDPFDSHSVTVWLEVQGCTVNWPMLKHLTPEPPPKSPECEGDVKTYTMRPYGALKVHMSELPVMRQASNGVTK